MWLLAYSHYSKTDSSLCISNHLQHRLQKPEHLRPAPYSQTLHVYGPLCLHRANFEVSIYGSPMCRVWDSAARPMVSKRPRGAGSRSRPPRRWNHTWRRDVRDLGRAIRYLGRAESRGPRRAAGESGSAELVFGAPGSGPADAAWPGATPVGTLPGIKEKIEVWLDVPGL